MDWIEIEEGGEHQKMLPLEDSGPKGGKKLPNLHQTLAATRESRGELQNLAKSSQ